MLILKIEDIDLKIYHILFLSFVLSNSIKSTINPENIYIGTPVIISSDLHFNSDLILEAKNLLSTNNVIDLDTMYFSGNQLIQIYKIWEVGIHELPEVMIFARKDSIIVDSTLINNLKIVIDSTKITSNSLKTNKDLILIKNNALLNSFKYLLFILASFIIMFFIKKKSKKKNNNRLKNLSIYNKKNAISELNKLDLEKKSIVDINRVFTDISIIFRKYISSKYFFNATKMTSDDIKSLLIKKMQNDEIAMQIDKFLLKLDLLKYSNINNNEIVFIECKKDAIDIIDLLDKN